MSWGLLEKAASSVKYKKVGNSYKFFVTFGDNEIPNFLSLILGNNKQVTIKGKKVEFLINRDETTAGQFIDFAKSAGLLK